MHFGYFIPFSPLNTKNKKKKKKRMVKIGRNRRVEVVLFIQKTVLSDSDSDSANVIVFDHVQQSVPAPHHNSTCPDLLRLSR